MSPRQRRYLLLLAYTAVLLPLVIGSAFQALQSNANSPIHWVTDSFPPRHDYDQFRNAFGAGDLVLLSWPGCTVDEPRLDQLSALLRRGRQFHDAHGNWYFERVLTGREVLHALTLPPLALDRDEALGRLRGTLIGPDGSTTCVVIGFTEAGLAQRQRLVGLIRAATAKTCRVPLEDQHLAGPVMDGLSVDLASQQSLSRFVVPSALIMLLVCYLCLGSLRAALVVFGVSLLGQAVTLALVHAGGEKMNAILIVLPPLVQFLAVTGGIHLMNYYFQETKDSGNADPAGRALQLAWLPITLSAATTAIGLASLASSELTPIRSFGIYGAAGVLLSTGLLLALIPGILSLWPISLRPSPARPSNGRAASTGQPGWQRLTTLIARHHLALVSLGAVLMIAVGLGIRFVKTSVRIETLFPPQSRILRDYAWLETHVGPTVPIEIVLHCDEKCPMSLRQRLTLVWQVEQQLSRMENVRGTMSAVTFVPNFPPRPDLPANVYQPWIDQALAASRPTFAQMRYLQVDSKAEQWRITAYVKAQDEMDYGNFLDAVRERVEPMLRDSTGEATMGLSARYTGIMPLVHEIQRHLMANLFTSFLGALAIIALLMTIVQAGILAGLVAMIPNVFPALLMFGAMGWLRRPMDIGSVMTASVALGIAVDDTLHFLTFFRRGLNAGRTRPQAVLHAYQHCGAAMIQTSVTCGLGLTVFLLSDFVPTNRFAWMMILQLGAALAGDLVLLPSLLLSPLGRFFQPETAMPAAVPSSRVIPPPSRSRTPMARV